jgi:hypothetical protein
MIEDERLLFIYHNALREFKKLYPNESPYVKIQCLRHRRYISSKTETPSWRTIKQITSKGELLKVTEVNDDIQVIKTRIITNTQEKKMSVIYDNDKKSIRDMTKIEKKNHGISVTKPVIITNPVDSNDKFIRPNELSRKVITVEKTSEIKKFNYFDVLDEEVTLGSEILTDELVEETHFIHIRNLKNEAVLTDDSIKTVEKLNKKVLLSENKFDFNNSDIVTILNDLKKSDKEDSEIEKAKFNKIFNSNYSTKELLQRYIDVQKKLNILRSKLTYYTTDKDLNWDGSIKVKGFILAIEDLVKYWWNQREDAIDIPDLYNDL